MKRYEEVNYRKNEQDKENKQQQYELIAKAMYLVLEQGTEEVKNEMVKTILKSASITLYGED